MRQLKNGPCAAHPTSKVRSSLLCLILLCSLAGLSPWTWAKDPRPEKHTTGLRTADYRLRLTKENIAALQSLQPASGAAVATIDGDGIEPRRITGKALPLKLLDTSRDARLEKKPINSKASDTNTSDSQTDKPAKSLPLEQQPSSTNSAQARDTSDSSQQAKQTEPEQPLGLQLSPSHGSSQADDDADAARQAENEGLSLESHGASSRLSDSPAGESPDGECPGAPDGQGSTQEQQPGDVDVEQDDHPYDAPQATSTEQDQPRPVDESAPSFTVRELAIEAGINRCLTYFMEHPENVARRGPWALMHAALPFGVESEVVAGNRQVNTIGWMCFNGVCARQRMFQPTRSGFRTNVGPGVQGHEGQFLAILAQSRVQATYPLKIGNRKYTVADLVRYEMATCREKSELTFKLIGLSYYLKPDQRWRDNRGRTWNLEKMLAEEIAQPVNGAACGGTHRLMGLSYAVIERQRRGADITGTWSRAEEYLNDYINYTMTLQNPDGSFSTNWFESRGNESDVERKVQTTGHILEWLIFTLPDEHLRSPRIQSSMEYLLNTVGARPERDWPIGPRGHALRAMALYNQRIFGAEAGKLEEHLSAYRDVKVVR